MPIDCADSNDCVCICVNIRIFFLCLCICVFVYLSVCVSVHIPSLRPQVINTGRSLGLREPIDCADSNDCFCNEMILTAQIDHLWLRVIKLVSSERRSHIRMRKPF